MGFWYTLNFDGALEPGLRFRFVRFEHTRRARDAVASSKQSLSWLPRRSTASYGYSIIVVKPTEHWHRDDLGTFAVELMRTRNRDLLTNSLVRSAGIEIARSELFENAILDLVYAHYGGRFTARIWTADAPIAPGSPRGAPYCTNLDSRRTHCAW